MTLFTKVKQRLCRHRFDVDDIVENRGLPERARITWPCFKCDKTFTAHCGLDILKHGSIGDKAGVNTKTEYPDTFAGGMSAAADIADWMACSTDDPHRREMQFWVGREIRANRDKGGHSNSRNAFTWPGQ